MRKLFLIINIFILSAAAMSAQTAVFRSLAEKYSDREGYNTVEIAGAITGNVDIRGISEDMAPLLRKMDNMYILMAAYPDEGFFEEVERMIRNGGYKLMTSVNDGRQTSRFYIIEKNGKTIEFLMTVLGEGDNIIMSINGKNLDVSRVIKAERKAP